MGVKRLQIKKDLNYRRGYTWKACGYCDHYVPSFVIGRTGVYAVAEPRCKVIGLNPGRGYRINPDYLCDKYHYTSPLEFEVGGLVPDTWRCSAPPQKAVRTKEDYEPYGPEWEKEMMKLDKAILIGMLKTKGLEE
jgi:hypothetical protein